MLFHNKYNTFLLYAAICLLTSSCVYLERIQDRKEKSQLRFDDCLGKTDGNIRTDGVYIDEYYVKYPKWNPWGVFEPIDNISCVKFFEDGTFFHLGLHGNVIDSIRPWLGGFDIERIQIRDLGLYSCSKNNVIRVESYWQNDILLFRHLFPYQLYVDSILVFNDSVIIEKRHNPVLSGTLVFIPCSIPITSHHPFKSKRFLWSDKKARKQYLREWKKIKKERKKSKIKYVYRE
jgi:hypothetical protein